MWAKHKTQPPHRWLAALFRQPPKGFYRTPAVYLSGGQMEIEHFRCILTYSPDCLCLQMPHGRFTVHGDELKIDHPHRHPPDPAGPFSADGLRR